MFLILEVGLFFSVINSKCVKYFSGCMRYLGAVPFPLFHDHHGTLPFFFSFKCSICHFIPVNQCRSHCAMGAPPSVCPTVPLSHRPTVATRQIRPTYNNKLTPNTQNTTNNSNRNNNKNSKKSSACFDISHACEKFILEALSRLSLASLSHPLMLSHPLSFANT